ncbi:MAG: tripartite tricarboxylate transporter TctB family protein [Lautropia sp.]
MISRARLRRAAPHLAMLGVAGLLWWAALGIDGEAAQAAGRIGPDFWPKLVVGFLAALCLWEVVARLSGSKDAPSAAAADADAGERAGASPSADDPSPADHPGRLLAGIACIVGYAIGVEWTGFFVATALFLSVFMYVGGLRRPWLSIALGLGGSFALIVVFMRVAYVSLPLGTGPFRELSLALLRLIGVN